MAPRVIIVNTPGLQGPQGPSGVFDGQVTSASYAATASMLDSKSPLILSGSASITGSLFNVVTPEFQVVSNPAYLTNHFFLIRNQYSSFKIGTLSTDTGFTLTTQADTALTLNNETADVFILTKQGVAYFATQSALPNLPIEGGLLFSGSDFFVST
jgi:hypothetical protein